ncbi:hypothetical protein J6590_034651 [Homalodisca vitripennis]|nr:hypothetical protein J6590_034651 [Homalodisca vitripennis]
MAASLLPHIFNLNNWPGAREPMCVNNLRQPVHLAAPSPSRGLSLLSRGPDRALRQVQVRPVSSCSGAGAVLLNPAGFLLLTSGIVTRGGVGLLSPLEPVVSVAFSVSRAAVRDSGAGDAWTAALRLVRRYRSHHFQHFHHFTAVCIPEISGLFDVPVNRQRAYLGRRWDYKCCLRTKQARPV